MNFKRVHESEKKIPMEIRKWFEVKITKIWHIKIHRAQLKLVLGKKKRYIFIY